VDIVAKGVPHYFKDGTLHKGGMHKMPNGKLHSGKTHTKSSKRLFHLDELSKTTQAKVKGKKSGTQKKSKKS
jgi:hypothetical protein